MNLKLTYSKQDEAQSAQFAESEQQLWEAFKYGERTALAKIYQMHFFKLYNYGMKISSDSELVKDCIQELFIYLWKHKHKLSTTTSIKYYLFKSLRRKILEEVKKNHKKQFGYEDYSSFVFESPQEEKIIASQITSEQSRQLSTYFNQLPKRQKEALFLRYYENLSPEEVSSIMSLSIESTYVLFSKAIHFLRKHMPRVISMLLPLLLMHK